jgi:hypothetical protein
VTAEDNYVPLPPAVLDAMPNAQAVKRQLLNAMDTEYGLLVQARGDVTRKEDVFQVTRKVAAWVEQAKDLKAVFEAGRKRGLELLEDELVAAGGEQDGVPNERTLKVPDAGGDLVVSANTANVYHIDQDSLISATIAVHLGGGEVAQLVDIVNGDHPTIEPDQFEDALAEIITGVVTSVLGCGKFEPQVTKVRTYADDIARGGEDSLAAVVSGAIRKDVKIDGVTLKRKATS